jgi:uncharacterized protein YbjT (DUF2867 family)
MRSPRWFATPAKPAAPSANPAGCTYVPRAWTTRDLTEALDGIRTVFIAMGSIGIEGVLQRIAINAAAGIPSIEQVTRLSVLNASADSLGINQRAHYSIDQFASSTAVPYSTIRPAIFSASLLSAAPEVRASRTWTGSMTLSMLIALGQDSAVFAPADLVAGAVVWIIALAACVLLFTGASGRFYHPQPRAVTPWRGTFGGI